MKKLFAIVLMCFVSFVNANRIDKIVVFGDSLSDNGNIDALTRRMHQNIPMVPIIPKPDVYYQGHFSNGEVWSERFAEELGFDSQDINQYLDHAYGGAWAESVLRSRLIFPPSLSVQITNFLVENYFDNHKADHLYTVWIGSNDYLSQRIEDLSMVKKTVDTVVYNLDRLAYYGARKFVVPNLPDLGKTPKAKSLGLEKEYTDLTIHHNAELKKALAELRQKYPDVTIIEPDINAALQEIFEKGPKNQYGFKHFQEACYTGEYYLNRSPEYKSVIKKAGAAGLDLEHNTSLMVAAGLNQNYTICSDPEGFVFWDAVHPTSKVHQLIGDEVTRLLKDANLF